MECVKKKVIVGGGICEVRKSRFGQIFDRYKKDDTAKKSTSRADGSIQYGKKVIDWDIAPTQKYFDEIFRVSKNQIIWGGNYFALPPTRCFVVWKKLSISENFSMAMCEYAWTSFSGNAKLYECMPQGIDEARIHACQKPTKLYEWLLFRFAKDCKSILDPYLGSASSAIAAHRAKIPFTGIEIDKEYYENAKVRIMKEVAQGRLF